MSSDIDRILRARVVAEGLPVTPGRNPWKLRATSGLLVPAGYGTGAEVTLVGGAWAPINDIAMLSGLYLPTAFGGGYSTTGTPGVDEVGTWLDASGNARHADSSVVSSTAPVAHGSGYPVFDGGASGLVVSASFNGDLTTAANGAIVVIAEHDSPLAADAGNYQNPSMVSGAGATPHLNAADQGGGNGARFGGYDASNYIEVNELTFSPATSYVIAAKWDGLGIYSSLAGSVWGTRTDYTPPQVSLDGSNMGASAYIGMGYSYGHQWIGVIKAVAFYPDAADVDNAKLAQWQTWAAAQGLV